MPLADFLKNKQSNINQPQSSGSLSNFLNNKNTKPGIKVMDTPSTETVKVGADQKKQESTVKKTPWQWLSKQLMKPVGAVAAETEALGKFIGAGKTYIPGKQAIDVVSGKRDYSFSKLIEDNYVKPMKEMGGGKTPVNAARAVGFITDIAADPLNFIGGGLTKLGKLAEKVTSLTNAGKKISEGSKIWNDIQKSGYTVEQLNLAGSKFEQAKKGQRALFQVLGKPIISGEKVYQTTGKLGEYLNKITGINKVKSIISTSSGIKELDDVIDNYKNLADYRKQQVVDNAVKIENDIRKMGVEDVKTVIDVIERPEIRSNIENKGILKIADNIENLFKDIKSTEKSKDILRSELENYFPHIKNVEGGIKNTINSLFSPKVWSTSNPFSKERKISGTISEINDMFGKDFFQTNPAIAYAQRGLASSKAVTAREFLDEVATKFFKPDTEAPLRYMESTNPLFKGLKAEPEVVQAVDQYVKGMKPEELKLLVRGFDAVQNWWKGQALVSFSYHTRNMAGNFWNNWLAGVTNPAQYFKAKQIQSGKNLDNIISITQAGEKITRKEMLEAAKKNGVIGSGWYGKDIQSVINSEVSSKAKNFFDNIKSGKGLDPFSRENILMKTNKAVGQAIEDNARLAHFIDMVEKGFSFEDAGRSVKKYLFDYNDLTWTEKNILKRLAPFYTWTRKNIPLQIENLIVQPAKYSLLPKAIEQIENKTASPSTEKYMSSYLRDNIPVKIRKNKEGNYEYFMLGNWLPSAAAIDFLSQPFENILNMATPLIKTPIELWANKSLFFKNTLGEASNIEYYYKQPTEFVGISMRRKEAQIFRNIRILNDINNFISKGDKNDPNNSLMVKFLNMFFGKSVTYDISKAKTFYDRDTEERVSQLKASIKKAKKDNQDEYAKQLAEELKRFLKERYGK